MRSAMIVAAWLRIFVFNVFLVMLVIFRNPPAWFGLQIVWLSCAQRGIENHDHNPDSSRSVDSCAQAKLMNNSIKIHNNNLSAKNVSQKYSYYTRRNQSKFRACVADGIATRTLRERP